jgi:hypothetical protein
MALMALLLGAKEVSIPKEEDSFIQKKEYAAYRRESGIRCSNPQCVSVQKTETKYIKPEFKIVNDQPLILRCVYCDHEVHPPYVASSHWHEGRLENKKYHSADSYLAGQIKPENLIIFDSESEAKAQGFKPSSYAVAHH